MKRSHRPNFILITTDQQRADHLGCYDNAILRTPHIDGLAARGRTFDRFYVASGVCMANRASIMTGRHPSVHGVRCNGVPLDRDAVTFVDLLRADGYRTILTGKCHLQNMTDMEPEAFTPTPAVSKRLPPPELSEALRGRWDNGAYDAERKEFWRSDPEHRISVPYYGFDHVDFCSFHGDLVEGDYYRWLSEQVDDPEALRGEANALPDPRYHLTQAYHTAVPEELYPTSWIADRAIAQLEAAAQNDAPFFLHCSFTDPHHPFTPPGRYWEMYDPDEIILPHSASQPREEQFEPVRILRGERDENRARINSTVAYAATERELREATALTYGMITMIDDAIGRILTRLAQLGLAENTVVIFTSDHGDFMGDHGLLLKSALHYSSLIRVPCIWAEPGAAAPGTRTSGLWSSMDLGATILDRAGLAPSYGSQGASFASALNDPEAQGRPWLLIEEDGHAPTFGMNMPVRTRTAITERYRLTIYDQKGWGELYDLESDAEEMQNLYDLPNAAPIRYAMFEILSRALMEADDRLPVPLKRA